MMQKRNHIVMTRAVLKQFRQVQLGGMYLTLYNPAASAWINPGNIAALDLKLAVLSYPYGNLISYIP